MHATHEGNEYFIVTDGAKIEHLKTDLMVADILTKPLAYSGFRHFSSRMSNHISWEEMIRCIRPDANDDEIREAMGSQGADCKLVGRIMEDLNATSKVMAKKSLENPKKVREELSSTTFLRSVTEHDGLTRQAQSHWCYSVRT